MWLDLKTLNLFLCDPIIFKTHSNILMKNEKKNILNFINQTFEIYNQIKSA